MVIGVPSYERNFLWPFANHKGRQYCELASQCNTRPNWARSNNFLSWRIWRVRQFSSVYFKKYPQIELVLVLAYLNTGRDVSGYDSTVYPPLENVPRRFSISHRNRWMVESADVVVAYVLHDWGGAATTLRCAKQKKKQIISYRDEMGSWGCLFCCHFIFPKLLNVKLSVKLCRIFITLLLN